MEPEPTASSPHGGCQPPARALRVVDATRSAWFAWATCPRTKEGSPSGPHSVPRENCRHSPLARTARTPTDQTRRKLGSCGSPWLPSIKVGISRRTAASKVERHRSPGKHIRRRRCRSRRRHSLASVEGRRGRRTSRQNGVDSHLWQVSWTRSASGSGWGRRLNRSHEEH